MFAVEDNKAVVKRLKRSPAKGGSTDSAGGPDGRRMVVVQGMQKISNPGPLSWRLCPNHCPWSLSDVVLRIRRAPSSCHRHCPRNRDYCWTGIAAGSVDCAILDIVPFRVSVTAVYPGASPRSLIGRQSLR